MEVRWDDPKVQARYEDMISTLVKRLHPDAQRIDGSGGDDGRDVQIPSPGGPIIYELKSFTGRLSTGGRKRQITRSLGRAAGHNPCIWRLVVPIDHTDNELRWFEQITAEYSFPCEWLGWTWLNTELAQRPEIQRYFLDDYSAEVIRLLDELRGEELAAEDARTALLRARNIQQRLNDTDPFFMYNLSIGSGAELPAHGSVLSVVTGADRIDVVPRYATALKDRPITINATFEFDESNASHLEAFGRGMDFGDPVKIPSSVVKRLVVDAPAGLSAEFHEVELAMEGLEARLDDPTIVQAAVLAPDESLLGVHEFTLTSRRGGRRGVVLFGSDSTGLLSLELRGVVENETLTGNLKFTFKPVLPAVGLAVARWLTQVRPPNQVRIEFLSPSTGTAEAAIGSALVDAFLVKFFEAFEIVQRRAGVSFPVPDDITDQEWEIIHRAAEWLSPEKHQHKWTSTRLPLSGAPRESLERVLREEGGSLLIARDVTLDFRGRKLSLGRLAHAFQAVVTNADEVRTASDRGDQDVILELAPGPSDVAYEWLLQPGDPVA